MNNNDKRNFGYDCADGTETVAVALRDAFRAAIAEPPAIADAAAAAGLLDVAYATLDSPVGKLVLATTPVGLARLAYVDGDHEDEVLADMAARLSPRMLSAPRRLDEPRRELDEYFAGRRRQFELALDLTLMTDFTRRVLTATAAIPYGSVSTYRDVATQAGSPRGSRAAGNALGSNPLPIVLPCHRVVHSGGGIGGYTGGVERKRTLLAIEAGPRVSGVTLRALPSAEASSH
jgi:methylated-DNA-[protein]-cysteine S-methyltransferase